MSAWAKASPGEKAAALVIAVPVALVALLGAPALGLMAGSAVLADAGWVAAGLGFWDSVRLMCVVLGFRLWTAWLNR